MSDDIKITPIPKDADVGDGVTGVVRLRPGTLFAPHGNRDVLYIAVEAEAPTSDKNWRGVRWAVVRIEKKPIPRITGLSHWTDGYDDYNIIKGDISVNITRITF